LLTGQGISAMALGDLNRDGKLDVVTSGSAGLVESYYPCHGVLLLTIVVCGSSGRNRKTKWDDSSARGGWSREGVCAGLAGSSTAPQELLELGPLGEPAGQAIPPSCLLVVVV